MLFQGCILLSACGVQVFCFLRVLALSSEFGSERSNLTEGTLLVNVIQSVSHESQRPRWWEPAYSCWEQRSCASSHCFRNLCLHLADTRLTHLLPAARSTVSASIDLATRQPTGEEKFSTFEGRSDFFRKD